MKEFGVQPRIGWQIDPFGHSNTNARVFAEMGFDAWFFARGDWVDKNKRAAEKALEWVWFPNNATLGGDVNIFTHYLWHHYSAPVGMGFDILDGDEPYINNADSEEFNAKSRAEDFMQHLDDRIAHYLTDDVFVLFGDDFRYMNAAQNYQSMDNMIAYMNKYHSDKYFFRYSTPSEYIDAQQKHNVAWPTKYDDMMPYSDAPLNFWTGYFTSRANDKGYIRTGGHQLHASSQLYAEKMFDQTLSETEAKKIVASTEIMLDVVGITQHHDAVTGTGKQHVANDYSRIIYDGIKENSYEYSKRVAELVKKETSYDSEKEGWRQCAKTNATYLDCPIAKFAKKSNYTMAVAVHNPSSMDLSTAKVAVPHGNYYVKYFDKEKESFEKAETSVLCNKDHTHGNATVKGKRLWSCFAHVKVHVPANGFALLALAYDPKAQLKARTETIRVGDRINSNELTLIFAGYDDKSSKIDF